MGIHPVCIQESRRWDDPAGRPPFMLTRHLSGAMLLPHIIGRALWAGPTAYLAKEGEAHEAYLAKEVGQGSHWPQRHASQHLLSLGCVRLGLLSAKVPAEA